MKITIIVLRFSLSVLIGSFLLSCQYNKGFKIINPLNVNRIDEVVVLSRSDVETLIDLKDSRLLSIKEGDNIIPYQLDDLNGDKEWDELTFLIDIGANEVKEIEVFSVLENEVPKFKKRTNLRLGIYQDKYFYKEVDNYRALSVSEKFKVIAQGESVSWENDKMAFRVYFDCRNVKDLFGKLKTDMIIDKIHTKEIKNYHSLNDWGMDVLHCGSSLGAGGIALLKNDSLYRLGSTDIYEYKKITEGPVRSIFDLVYKGWHVDGDVLEATERISIYPGKYWFQSDVKVIGAPKDSQIITGIVTSKLNRNPFVFDTNLYSCIGTHDKQSLNKDELGMAIMVPKKGKGKIGRTSDVNFFKQGFKTLPQKGFSNIISETYYIGQHFNNNIPKRHYFFSVWGLENNRWKTEDRFKSYLSEEAKKMGCPLLVEF